MSSAAQSSSRPPGEFGRVPVTAGLLAAALALVLSLAYWLLPTLREVIVFVAAAATAAGTVVSTYYSSLAVRYTAKLNAETAREAGQAAQLAKDAQDAALTRAKKAVSLRIIERWNDPMFSRTLVKWREQRSLIEASSLEETKRRLANDYRSRAVVQEILNRIEEIAITVQSGEADEKLLKESIKPVLDDVFLICKHWIESNRLDDPLAWTNIEEVHLRWRKQ